VGGDALRVFDTTDWWGAGCKVRVIEGRDFLGFSPVIGCVLGKDRDVVVIVAAGLDYAGGTGVIRCR